jgi:hypothetical protein
MSKYIESQHPRGKGEHGGEWVKKIDAQIGVDIGEDSSPLEEEEAFASVMPAYESPVYNRRTIRRYAGNDHFRRINEYGRKGPESLPESERKDTAKDVENLDAMIESAPPLKRPIKTIRGVKDVDGMFGDEGSTVGNTFQDNGFVSTSTSERAAWKFHGHSGAQIHIHIPAGNKAMKILLQADDDDSEKEIMLPRGSRFKVLSDKYHDDYEFRVVHVELL